MFEGLIEKILLAKLGKFIEGLSKDSLKVGILSGDITLENVFLKPDALLMMQIPIIIRYGCIKKLAVKIPWSKLSESPVELVLEGLYIVVIPQEKSEWDYSEQGEIIKRKEFIEACETKRKQIQEQKQLSAEDEVKQKSFIEKLTLRIVDNLKLTIKDINVRFEYMIEDRCFSAGITLNRIESFTTDANWTAFFTDRFQAGQDSGIINKLVNIVNFSIYWNSEDSNLLNFLSSKEEIQKCLKLQIDNCESNQNIISPITAQVKITHYNLWSGFENPQYKILLIFPDVKFVYKQNQFHDCVKLFEYFADFNQFILKIEHKKKFKAWSPDIKNARNLWQFAINCVLKSVKQKKNRAIDMFKLTKSKKDYYQEQFKMLSRELRQKGSLSKEKEDLYNKIIFISEYDDLSEWTNHVIAVVEHEEEAKKNKKTSWFSVFGKNKDKAKGNEEEKYEEIFKNVNSSASLQDNIPPSYVWMKLDFELHQSSIEISKKNVKGENEKIVFVCQNLYYHLDMRRDGGDMSLNIHDLYLASIDENEEIIICKQLSQSETPFIRAAINLKPLDLDCAAYFAFRSQPFEVIYNSKALSRILSFFVVPSSHQAAKVIAGDILQSIADTSQETITDLLYGESKYIVNISACGPKLKFPSKNKVLIISLGDLDICTEDSSQDDYYSRYQCSLKSIEMVACSKRVTTEIVSKFDIYTSIDFLKSKYQKRKKYGLFEQNVTSVKTKIQLPLLNITVSPAIYEQLLEVEKSIKLEDEAALCISTDKAEILKNSLLSSPLQKLGTNMQLWYNYHAVLSESYIYFFKDESDEIADTSYYIKDCNLILQEINKIKLENRYGECILCFSSPDLYEIWLKTLNKQISDLSSTKSAAVSLERARPGNHLANIVFFANEISCKLLDEEDYLLCEFKLSEIINEFNIRPYDVKILSKLQHFEMIGFKQNHSEEVETLAKSSDENELIGIEILVANSQSPYFKGEDISLTIRFGSLNVIFNPDLIRKIFWFFTLTPKNEVKKSSKTASINPDHILCHTIIFINSISATLITNETPFPLALSNVQDLYLEIFIKNGSVSVIGSLKNLEISDLTNYPYTGELSSSMPSKLFSIRQNEESLLSFSFVSYDKDNFKKPADRDSILDLNMNSICVNFMQQPVMRLIDVFMMKILTMFDSKKLIADYLSNDVNFTSINVTVNNPLIYLSPYPGHNGIFVVDLGNIQLSNKRLENEGFFNDVYMVTLKNMNLRSNYQKISENFEVRLDILTNVYSVLQENNLELDRSIKIIGESDRIKLHFSQNDYALLMRLLKFNLAYDDQRNDWFFYGKNSNSIIYNAQKSLILLFKMSIKDFSILFIENSIKILEVFVLGQNLEVKQFTDKNIKMSYSCHNLCGLINTYSSKNEVERQKTQQIFSVPTDSVIKNIEFQDDGTPSSLVLFGPINDNFEYSPPILDLSINYGADGSQDIHIEMNEIRINFHLGIFLELSNYFSKNLVSPEEFENITHKSPYASKNNFSPKPSLHFSLFITSPIIVIPSLVTNRVLALQSDIELTYSISYCWQGTKIEELIIQLIKIEKFEIYSCLLDDLSGKNSFQNIQKRKIIEPVQVSLELKNENIEGLITGRNLYQIGCFYITISYKDLLLINDALNIQLESKEKYDGNSGLSKNSNTKKYIIEEKQNKDITNIFSVQGLKLIIINDASGAYSPVLNFETQPFSFKMSQQNDLCDMRGIIEIKSDYYNPRIDIWEPFIEPIMIRVEYKHNPNLLPQKQAVFLVDDSNPFNINLTEVMISHFLWVSNTWNDKNSQIYSDCLEKVSPLCIYNDLGYTIIVEKNSNISKNDHGFVMIIEQGKFSDYEFKTSDTRVMEFSQSYLNITIYDSEIPCEPITNVPFNRVQSLTYNFSLKNQKYPVIIDIELKESRKLLRVKSPITIINQTNADMKILLHNGFKTEEKFCEISKSCIVPVDFTKSLFGAAPICFGGDPKLHSFQEFCSNKNGYSIEMKCEEFYFIMLLKKDKINPEKKTILLCPTFIIRNFLPNMMTMNLFCQSQYQSNVEDLEIESGGSASVYNAFSGSEIQYSVMVAPYIRSPQTLLFSKKKPPPKTMTLLDPFLQETKINIEYQHNGSRIFTFYPIAVIINSTALPLSFFYKNAGGAKPFAGQCDRLNIIPIQNENKIAIGYEVAKSKFFKIDAVGLKNIIEFESPKRIKYQFTYEVTLNRVVENEMLFMRAVKIAPRFLFVNLMNDDLLIKQHNSTGEFLLARESREPFHWMDSTKDELIAITIPGQIWNYSGVFSISSIEALTLQLKNLYDPGIFKLIKVEVRLIESIAYVMFQEENTENSSYRLENCSSNFFVSIYQKGYKDDERWVDCNSSLPFAWTEPFYENILVVEFFYGSFGCIPERYEEIKEFSFNKNRVNYEIGVNVGKEVFFIYAATYNQGSMKILKISDLPLNEDSNDISNIHTQWMLTIPCLGISLIENSHEHTRELLYLNFSDIILLTQQTKNMNRTELAVKNFQIDNQLNQNAVFPVLLYFPSIQNNAITMLISTSTNTVKNYFYFETLEVVFQPINLNVESSMVKKLLSVSSRIHFNKGAIELSTSTYTKHFHPSWSFEDTLYLDLTFYFESFSLSPSKIILSYTPIQEEKENKAKSFDVLIKALGMAITAVEEAPIEFSEVKMTDLYGTQSQIMSALTTHYKTQLTGGLIHLIGHSVVLGNPVGLLNNLKTGISDFFNKPIDGMSGGAKGAGKGFIQGADSLMKNTVQGAFGTVSMVTNTVATGISSITSDKEYMMERQQDKVKNKPKNIFQGLGMGASSLFKGIGKGITDIATKPIKGYKKDKGKGAIKETGKAMAGLITKPIAGVFDAVTQAAEGIKNSASNRIPPSAHKRSRLPRPVYGENSMIKCYNNNDAYVVFELAKKDKTFINEKFMAMDSGTDQKRNQWLLALYETKITLIDADSFAIKWIIHLKMIEIIEIMENGCAIHIVQDENNRAKGRSCFFVPINTPRIIEILGERISVFKSQ
ncbi:VPS13_4 [Blepharisma stoltei]|uniref:PH domain-containing protein n=1 Tax=Blepharisma stoltei TaxID=1481888 RepID=A0AAU9KJ68_9CILI|nr:unnamed protein product [Blepharisma stoltei]